MVSRAYHDTLFMAQVCPATMIFIPCRGGFSHRPDEYSSPDQIQRGVEVLALALARLAANPQGKSFMRSDAAASGGSPFSGQSMCQ
jgi:hypothetical protein